MSTPTFANVPAEFPGTAEEKLANYRTHSFDDESSRCIFCDCRPWGTVADWECGEEIPREWVQMSAVLPRGF